MQQRGAEASGRAVTRVWDMRRQDKARRLAGAAASLDGKVADPGALKDLLHTVIRPGDKVALEGDNQKQGDFLSRTLAVCDPAPGLEPSNDSMSRSPRTGRYRSRPLKPLPGT